MDTIRKSNRAIPNIVTVAAIAALLAIWAGTHRQPQTTAPTERLAAPGLEEQINDLSTVRLTGAGAKPIATLVRTDKGWIVTEKDGYPADVGKLREFLLKLLDSHLVEAKTAVASSYAKLGVEDVAGADAKGVLLELEGPKKPIKLIIGNPSSGGGDGTYVRAVDDPQSWLASGKLTPGKTAANWIAHDLLDILAARVQSVNIASAGKALRVFKNTASEPNFQAAGVPKGRELSSPSAANEPASALAGLRIEDVLKADAVSQGNAKPVELSLLTFDGLLVRATAWEADAKHYARFEAALDGTAANAHVDAEQTKARAEFEKAKAAADAKDPSGTPTTTPAPPAPAPAVADAAKDREERLAKLRKDVEQMQTKLTGWSFVIPAHKYEILSQTMDDLLKPLSDSK